MDDNHYKKQELENFIWHLIKDKTEPTYTGTDLNEINPLVTRLELKKIEVDKIKDNQLDRLIKELEDKEKEKIDEQNEEEEKKRLAEAIVKKEAEDKRIEGEKKKEAAKLAEAVEKEKKEEAERKVKEEADRIKKQNLRNQLKISLGIFLVACLVGAGGFLVWKNTTSVVSETDKEYEFKDLKGIYQGEYDSIAIRIELFLKDGKEKYKIKGESNYGDTVSYSKRSKVVDFLKPKQGLGKFDITEVNDTIVLISKDATSKITELKKIQ